MSTNLLIVEDNSHKLDRIIDFLRVERPDFSLTQAHSYSSGCKAALSGAFEIAILDISLPTYDKVGNESGGRNRPFGGREIARKLIRRNLNTAIIFLTQFDAFSDQGRSHTLDSLEPMLRAECGPSFIGLVHYDSSRASWKEELKNHLMVWKKDEDSNC